MQANSVEMKLMMCINHTFPETLYPKEEQRTNRRISSFSFYGDFGFRFPFMIKCSTLSRVKYLPSPLESGCTKWIKRRCNLSLTLYLKFAIYLFIKIKECITSRVETRHKQKYFRSSPEVLQMLV